MPHTPHMDTATKHANWYIKRYGDKAAERVMLIIRSKEIIGLKPVHLYKVLALVNLHN